MIPLKKKIRNYFNKASNSYENVAYVQRQSAEFLVEKLLEVNDIYPQTILDLGTGTGYIPELLIKYYPKSLYRLNDIAPKMLEVCSSKFINHDNLRFSIGDMENIDFSYHQLIISNFALQWADDLWKILQKFHQKSDIFAFSCLLNGTFQEWQNILSSYKIFVVKQYPKEQELVAYCNKLSGLNDKCYFWSKDFQITFPNYFAFMKYLKNLGAGINVDNLPLSVSRSLIEKHNDELTVSYKVFFGILKKGK